MLSRKVVSPQKCKEHLCCFLHKNARNICVAICFGFRKNIFILTGLFVNTATRAPSVHTGQVPGKGSLAPLQVKLSKSSERLQDNWSNGVSRTSLLGNSKVKGHTLFCIYVITNCQIPEIILVCLMDISC